MATPNIATTVPDGKGHAPPTRLTKQTFLRRIPPGFPFDYADFRRNCKWLRDRTDRLLFGSFFGGHPVYSLKSEQLLSLLTLKRWQSSLGKDYRHAPTITNRMYLSHMLGEERYYYLCAGQPKVAECVPNIDIDCHDRGTPEGAIAFAEHLRRTFFPGMVYNPSTRGAHGFLVLRKLGHSPEVVKAQLLALQGFLAHEAHLCGADISGVEVKGTPNIYHYEGRELCGITYGALARLPRTDIRHTFSLDMWELDELTGWTRGKVWEEMGPLGQPSNSGARTILVYNPPPKTALDASSWSPEAITPTDRRDLPRLAEVAREIGLSREGGHRAVKVTDEDGAIFLLILRFFTQNMNPDGSIPFNRFREMWNALHKKGQVPRAFSNNRYCFMKRALAVAHRDGELLLEVADETYGSRRAQRWRASAKLMELIAGRRSVAV